MSEYVIGVNISNLRKEKGVTQEVLAEYVGVSAQAVSKWESGGSPDSSLLPIIADFFNVSIDRLFARKNRSDEDFATTFKNYFLSLPLDERIQKAYELYTITMPELGEYPGLVDREVVDMVASRMMEMMGGHSCQAMHFSAKGLAKARMDSVFKYFIIVPEPDDGWGNHFKVKDEYVSLFCTLSDVNILKVIFFLHSRMMKNFTVSLLEKEVGLSKEKAEDVLKSLDELKMIFPGELELDNKIITIYEFKPADALIPFLLFADELIAGPCEANFNFETRNNEPYLSKREVSK